MKNLSSFTRGKKNKPDTCPYSDSGRHTQQKPCLSQPALVISECPPERDGSPSSVSPSSQSRSSPLKSGTPIPLNTAARSLDLVYGGRSGRDSVSAQPISAANTRLLPETTNHNKGRSPQSFVTSPTSPASGRSVSFDIPRSPFKKDDDRLKLKSLETRSRHANPSGDLIDVPEDRSPHDMIDPSPNPPGTEWSFPTNTPHHASEIEGLPSPSESIDPSLFEFAEPSCQPPPDEIPNLTPDRTPTPPPRDIMPPKPPNYHEATGSPMLTSANISPTILPPKRVALLRLTSMPPPAFTMNDEDGSVRFSPTPIGRHFSTAVLPLPPTSITRRSSSPAPSVRSSASRARLRSVPALAMDGAEEGGGSDDDDDNDEEHVPLTPSPVSEDEDEATTTEREGSSTYVSANTSPVDPRPGLTTPPSSADMDKTPVTKLEQDYFSIRPARPDSSGWASSSSNPQRALLTPRARPTALYHQASKSMVNLMSSPRRDLSIIEEETKGKGKATDSVASAIAVEDNVLPEGSRIHRRRSLPTFTASTEPPPYPSLEIPGRPGPKVIPRDEEGKEQLPEYSNDILISAVLPRKREFSSPGVQARDRKWRRVLCVLEGTAFRIFEPPTSAVGIGAVGRWWEKTVGVGDLTSDAPRPKKTETAIRGSQKIYQDSDGDEGRSTVRPTASVVVPERETGPLAKGSKLHPRGLLHLNGNASGTSSRRQSGETARGDERGGYSASPSRPSVSSITSNTTGRPSVSKRATPPTPVKSAQLDQVPCLRNCEPLRVYTLQHAESGLASDYLKRKNVIRVRMEGEQFLLQVPTIQAVVDWIEVSVLDRVPGGSLSQILTITRVFKLRLA